MDLTSWAFYAFIVLAALAAVVMHYRLREPAGRGRGALAALRWVVVALLVLLLFDPVLPAVRAARGAVTIVLLDASLSMRMPDTSGETRWQAARAAVSRSGDARILLFGEEEPIIAESIDEAHPSLAGSRLAPALAAAAERGGASVVVVTDGAIDDPEAAARVMERTGMATEIVRVGGRPAWNAGITEAEAPAWAEVGVETEVRVAVAAVGEDGPDSLIVVLRRGGAELARARLAMAEADRLASGSLRFTPRSGAVEAVRLDIELLADDAEADDNRRSLYVRVSDAPAGVALVTFSPDQEPRFLLPVLERALGLPTRGWMALRGGSYITLGDGLDAGRPADEATVRRATREADLVVLHGLGADAPEWARAVASEASRVLLFPAQTAPAGLPFEPGIERPGDWYLSPDVPASPVAPLLAGLDVGDAPPLVALRVPPDAGGFWGPLNVRLGRRGAEEPVALARALDGRRIVVALGDGYWRWAFSGGAARSAYDRLWSALAGWLVDETGAVTAAAIRPVDLVVPRGASARWVVPSGVDSINLTVHESATGDGPDDGRPVLDTVLVARDGRVTAPPLPPGHYRYRARPHGVADTAAPAGGADAAAGPLTVESFSPEFTRRVTALAEAPGTATAISWATRDGRPLRTSAWPYVLLATLLCLEWTLRRRWGLR